MDHLNKGSRCITLWDKVEVVGEQKDCKDCATTNITTPRTTTNNNIIKKNPETESFLLVYTWEFPVSVSFHSWVFRSVISAICSFRKVKTKKPGVGKKTQQKTHHCVMMTFCRTICCTPCSFAPAALWIMEKIFPFRYFLFFLFCLEEYKCSVVQCSELPFAAKGKTCITHKWNDDITCCPLSKRVLGPYALPSLRSCSWFIEENTPRRHLVLLTYFIHPIPFVPFTANLGAKVKTGRRTPVYFRRPSG